MERRYTSYHINERAGNMGQLSDKEFQDLLDTVLYEKARRDMDGNKTTGITICYDLIFEGRTAMHTYPKTMPTRISLRKQSVEEYFDAVDPF